jgi:hypothetical protein
LPRQLLRRLEALLQRGGAAAELAHPLPVAPGSCDTRLLQGALGFLTLADGAPVPRFGKDGSDQLSRVKQVEIAEERVAVGSAYKKPDDRSHIRTGIVCISFARHTTPPYPAASI